MGFEINGCHYTIKLVSQEELQNYYKDDTEGYYYGQTHFQEQEIWVDKTLSYGRMKKTLAHELTHVYIREYICTRDVELTEDLLCDIVANSYDFVHRIIKLYFTKREEQANENNEKSS